MTGFAFPDIDPIAFFLGPLPVRWYALSYMAGFILGWRYCLYLAGLDKAVRPTRDDIDDFLPWVILAVILGGRIGYVLFYNFSFFIENPLEALQVWHGGMSFHGGALGVISMLFLYPILKGIPKLRLADIVCAAVPIGLFFGRLANFINGELYGRVTDVAWAVRFPSGGGEPRHPSQLYEAGLEGAVLFLILFMLIRNNILRQKEGLVSGAFLMGYGLFRAFIELFRQPDAQIGFIADTFSMGQILCLPMILAGLGMMIYALRRVSKSAKTSV
jgi:phosphatidylglycerol---prolipoprotein diacylglyceryl transferase